MSEDTIGRDLARALDDALAEAFGPRRRSLAVAGRLAGACLTITLALLWLTVAAGAHDSGFSVSRAVSQAAPAGAPAGRRSGAGPQSRPPVVLAHDAAPTAAKPLGWTYPFSCCADFDCRAVPETAVREGGGGLHHRRHRRARAAWRHAAEAFSRRPGPLVLGGRRAGRPHDLPVRPAAFFLRGTNDD